MNSFAFLMMVVLAANSYSLVSSEKLGDACQGIVQEYEDMSREFWEQIPPCVGEMGKQIAGELFSGGFKSIDQIKESFEQCGEILQSREVLDCFEEFRENTSKFQNKMGERMEKISNSFNECGQKLEEIGTKMMLGLTELYEEARNDI